MRIVVQKFGGTSVVTPGSRQDVVERIKEALSEGLQVAVVVSAMGRAGDPYATDTLLGLLGDDQGADADPRDRDLLAACGEIISCVVLAHTLRSRGIPAVALTGREAGIVTDDNFGNARIVRAEPDRVLDHLRQGRVAVVAGFQGATEDGQVTTLGRGGSDTTAAVLGAALRAERIDIFKDVPGVYTADPRLVPDAAMLERVTYREIVELAHSGAKVVHPRAVEIAMAGRIPMRILATDGRRPGTLVDDAGGVGRSMFEADRVVTGVAHVPVAGAVPLAGPRRGRRRRQHAGAVCCLGRGQGQRGHDRCIRRGHRLYRGVRGPAENRAHPGRDGQRVRGARRTGQSIRGRRGHARRAGRHGPGSAGAGRGRNVLVRHRGLARQYFMSRAGRRRAASRAGAARRVHAGHRRPTRGGDGQ